MKKPTKQKRPTVSERVNAAFNAGCARASMDLFSDNCSLRDQMEGLEKKLKSSESSNEAFRVLLKNANAYESRLNDRIRQITKALDDSEKRVFFLLWCLLAENAVLIGLLVLGVMGWN